MQKQQTIAVVESDTGEFTEKTPAMKGMQSESFMQPGRPGGSGHRGHRRKGLPEKYRGRYPMATE
jgi:hypothetical protein